MVDVVARIKAFLGVEEVIQLLHRQMLECKHLYKWVTKNNWN